MPYLNMDLDYFEHRKTKRLIGLLGRGAEVLPIRLWSYCGKFHCENGRLTGYSEQEIESLATWWGKAGVMLPAMKTAEYMDRDETGWFMHEWLEHQGHLVAFKAKGKAMANTRWEKVRAEASRLAASNAASMLQAMPKKRLGSVGSVGSVGSEKRLEGAGRKGFPVTPDDAIAQCGLQMNTRDWILHCYDKALSRGGRDAKGIEIRDFPAFVRTEWKYEQNRRGREQFGGDPNGNLTPMDKKIRSDEHVLVSKHLADLRASYDGHSTWKPADLDKRRRLEARQRELEKMLGMQLG